MSIPSPTHKVLDLFSGIGGFSLGLDRCGGFETAAFCEIDKKAQKVLRKHWPRTPIYSDIKELTVERLQADGVPLPTVITGGFPCQDISSAGKGVGIVGSRSGLWSEMFRLIRDVCPKWAIIENVSALRSRGLALVLQDLCTIGYRAEWHCIPASAVGAPHQRDRIWILAYTLFQYEAQRRQCQTASHESGIGGNEQGRGGSVAERQRCFYSSRQNTSPVLRTISSNTGQNQWQEKSCIHRVVDGLPGGLDRHQQLGNAVVPQIPEMIGKAILQYESTEEGEGCRQ